MTFTVLTLFPELIEPILAGSVLGRAQNKGAVTVNLKNLRDWATDKHHTVDDTPYGGGPGMVLRADIIDLALTDLKREKSNVDTILLTPQGKRFTQPIAESLAANERDLILIAGHYEGFDERVRALVDHELSLGDFVLTGGEIAAVAIIDAITRLLPGALGADNSAHEESHSLRDECKNRLLEYPQYTRPESFKPASKLSGVLKVPDILKTGDHAKIAAWRLTQAKERTQRASSVDTSGVKR